MIGNLMQDVRYAARTFAKQPGFVAVAVLTLALGIGANSAIFSVIYGVLLKPLALKDPERVVKLWESMANGFTGTVSPPNLKDWREQNNIFTQLAAYQFANCFTPSIKWMNIRLVRDLSSFNRFVERH